MSVAPTAAWSLAADGRTLTATWTQAGLGGSVVLADGSSASATVTDNGRSQTAPLTNQGNDTTVYTLPRAAPRGAVLAISLPAGAVTDAGTGLSSAAVTAAAAANGSRARAPRCSAAAARRTFRSGDGTGLK